MNKVDSLYIHFPHCRHLCNYCDFYKTVISLGDKTDEFHSYLEESWGVHQKMMQLKGHSFSPLETLYIGGGTPSLWGKSGAEFFKQFMQEKGLSFSTEYEFTLEVNPGSWNIEGLKTWKKVGVNRYSVGLQSLNSNFLKILDRVHNIDDSYETLEYFHSSGVNYSVDLMLGLPKSEELQRDVLSELKEIMAFSPSHISLYILTTGDSYPYKDELPSEDWVTDEYLAVSQFLQERGMNHYEISNFSYPGFESTHNLNYWKGKSVAALGPSATGYLAEKESGYRYKWNPLKSDFSSEELGPSEVKLEQLYLSLRTNQGLNPEDLFLDVQEKKSFKKLAEKWISKDQGSWNKGKLVLNERGYILLDSLMNEVFLTIKTF